KPFDIVGWELLGPGQMVTPTLAGLVPLVGLRVVAVSQPEQLPGFGGRQPMLHGTPPRAQSGSAPSRTRRTCPSVPSAPRLCAPYVRPSRAWRTLRRAGRTCPAPRRT